MTDNWSGFTDAEIRAIGNNQRFIIDPKTGRNGSIGGVAVAKQSSTQRRFLKKNVVRERMLNGDKKPPYSVKANQSIPKDARLYIPQIPEEEEEEVEEEHRDSEKKKEEPTPLPPSELSLPEGEGGRVGDEEDDGGGEESRGPLLRSQSIEISATKLLQLRTGTAGEGSEGRGEGMAEGGGPDIVDALTKFQEKQKQMEEVNRQRKEMLQKALADRTKKTREEARRLNQIEEELKRLDAMLSNDVSIIRDQIEAASHDFMEAQKRYDKAEREFLEAKLCLFSHKERKELLTSHLCTIIEQNEIRKAKKLSDLMEKLQLGTVETRPQLPVAEPKKEGGQEA